MLFRSCTGDVVEGGGKRYVFLGWCSSRSVESSAKGLAISGEMLNVRYEER